MKFETCIAFVLAAETGGSAADGYRGGAYHLHPADPGGATKYGISQRLLDRVRPGRETRSLTLAQAKTIYREVFWQPLRGDEIVQPRVALNLLDFAVTSGIHRAVKTAQQVINQAGRVLAEDGRLGPATLARLNAGDLRLNAYRAARRAYYRGLNRPQFERGWCNRINQCQQWRGADTGISPNPKE